MRGRRAIAGALARLGGARALDRYWGPRRLTILAYHRVLSAPADFPFDPGLISATPADFARQVDFLARNFTVIGVDDLVEIVDGQLEPPERPLMITFDDGYIDNYREAFPILRARGVPAVAFLVSRWVGSDKLPWWDECAYRLRMTSATAADLPLVGPIALDGSEAARDVAHARISTALKAVPDESRSCALQGIRDALPVATGPPRERRFLTWDEAREMERAGVACQSHTASHPILSRVDPERLAGELTESAVTISRELGDRPVRVLAYPNGRPADHGPAVWDALAAAGYRLALTMEAGPSALDAVRAAPFTVERTPVERGDTFDVFRLKAMGAPAAAARARAAALALPRGVRRHRAPRRR